VGGGSEGVGAEDVVEGGGGVGDIFGADPF